MAELTEKLNQLMEAEATTKDISSVFDKIIRGLSPEDFWEFLKDLKVPTIRKMPESAIRILVIKLRNPEVDAYANSFSSCRSKVSKIQKRYRDFVVSMIHDLSDIERKGLARRLDPTLVPREERSWRTSSSSCNGGGGR